MMDAGSGADLLVVIAHPDDEAIWCGGILSALKGRFRLHILCATNADNAARKEEFLAACADLGAVPRMLGYKDGGKETFPDLTSDLDDYLDGISLASARPAGVLTHSPAGEEHWHPQHIQLHWQLSDWARAKGLDFGFFSCHSGMSAFSQLFTRAIPPARLVGSLPKRYLARECLRIARCLWRYRSHEMITVAVDRESKLRLLAIYDGQSLKGYGAYTSPREFLFTKNPEIIGALAGSQNEAAY